MENGKIEKISISLNDGIILCRADLSVPIEQSTQFAFYVFRNEKRVHVAWYSKSPSFEFDPQGAPGCYRMVVFVKFDEDAVETSKSASLFINPLEVSSDSFPLVDDQAVVYSLKGKFWNFPALYYPGENKALFVMMPSAIDRQKMVLPAFNRWTWAVKGVFPGSVLCVSDPTLDLHEELMLGWCLGDRKHCATTELAEFVTKLARSKGIPNEKIVIYGSSAGGFAALALSACIEGSVAVAINAQTDALSYNIAKQVELVTRKCFPGMSERAVRRKFSDRVNMTSRWGKVNSSRAFLVQNILDAHHYEVHFKPIWEALGGDPNQEGISNAGRHVAWVYRQEGGHVPETIEMTQKIIEMLELS